MTHHESHTTDTEGRKRQVSREESDVRQKAQDTAEQARHKARETAAEVTEEAKARTREMAGTAKEEARTMAESRKSQVTSELDTIAEAFRTSGQELRKRDEEPVARYANQIADRIEDASSYLSGRSVDQLLNDAEDFARQQPEIFLGGAFGLGLLVSRFFKSSERHGYERSRAYYTGGDYGYGGDGPGARTGSGGTSGTRSSSSEWRTRHGNTGESRLPSGATTTGGEGDGNA